MVEAECTEAAGDTNSVEEVVAPAVTPPECRARAGAKLRAPMLVPMDESSSENELKRRISEPSDGIESQRGRVRWRSAARNKNKVGFVAANTLAVGSADR